MTDVSLLSYQHPPRSPRTQHAVAVCMHACMQYDAVYWYAQTQNKVGSNYLYWSGSYQQPPGDHVNSYYKVSGKDAELCEYLRLFKHSCPTRRALPHRCCFSVRGTYLSLAPLCCLLAASLCHCLRTCHLFAVLPYVLRHYLGRLYSVADVLSTSSMCGTALCGVGGNSHCCQLN